MQEAVPTLMDVESKLRMQYEDLIKRIMIQQSPSRRGNIYRKIILSDIKVTLIRSQIIIIILQMIKEYRLSLIAID